MAKCPVTEKISRLFEAEDPKIKKIVFAAIDMAQTRRLSAETLAIKLYHQLDRILKEENDEA